MGGRGDRRHRAADVSIAESGQLDRLVSDLLDFDQARGAQLSFSARPTDAIDFEAGLLHVRQQLGRDRLPRKLKTPAGRREVILCAQVADLVSDPRGTEARGAEELIFQTTTGRGLDHRHVGNAFRLAVRRAWLTGPGRLSLHSLRHGFASLLIANGLDDVFVSRQLGHANATVTLSTYAHLFARADHAEAARSALDATGHAMRTVGATGL
jgi:integrase